MTLKEKEIERIEREIEILTQRLEELKSQPETSPNIELALIEDFPFKSGARARTLLHEGICTVEDLVYSNPSYILKIRYIGDSSFKILEEWMSKHDLKFLG